MEAPEKYPCPTACASLWRLPSHLAMTHAVVTRPRWAREHKLQNLHLSLSMGDWLAPPTGGRTRTRAEVNVRPRLLVMTKEAQPDEHEPNDQTRENHRDRAKDEDEQHERDMTFLGERPGRNKQLQ